MLDINTIKKYVLKNGGLTLNSHGLKADLKSGFMASYEKSEKTLDLKDLSSEIIAGALKEASKKRAFLGLWLNDNILYIDLSINIKDLSQALEFARANKQLAIYDIKNDKSIYLKEN